MKGLSERMAFFILVINSLVKQRLTSLNEETRSACPYSLIMLTYRSAMTKIDPNIHLLSGSIMSMSWGHS